MSTEFIIDFRRGDHYKGRKKSHFIYLSFSRPAHDSMIKNSQFELSYSSELSKTNENSTDSFHTVTQYILRCLAVQKQKASHFGVVSLRTGTCLFVSVRLFHVFSEPKCQKLLSGKLGDSKGFRSLLP